MNADFFFKLALAAGCWSTCLAFAAGVMESKKVAWAAVFAAIISTLAYLFG